MLAVREEIATIQKKVEVYLSLGRFDSAEKLLKTAITDFGAFANLLNLLGLIYHKQSRLPEAVAHFRKAIDANPKFVEAILNLSITLCDLSEYDEAQKVFSLAKSTVSAKQQIPELVMGRLANQHAACGKIYEQNEIYTEAIREYKKALSIFGRMTDVRMSLARLNLLIGKVEDAKLEFEELIRMEPNLTAARVWLGVVYYKLGALDLAKQQWNIAIKTSPYSQTARAYLHISEQLAPSSSL